MTMDCEIQQAFEDLGFSDEDTDTASESSVNYSDDEPDANGKYLNICIHVQCVCMLDVCE